MDGVCQAVSDAFDALVEAEGGVNISILKSTLHEMKDEMFVKIESGIMRHDKSHDIFKSNVVAIVDTVKVAIPFEFHYKGTNWPPESVQSPKETKDCRVEECGSKGH